MNIPKKREIALRTLLTEGGCCNIIDCRDCQAGARLGDVPCETAGLRIRQEAIGYLEAKVSHALSILSLGFGDTGSFGDTEKGKYVNSNS